MLRVPGNRTRGKALRMKHRNAMNQNKLNPLDPSRPEKSRRDQSDGNFAASDSLFRPSRSCSDRRHSPSCFATDQFGCDRHRSCAKAESPFTRASVL